MAHVAQYLNAHRSIDGAREVAQKFRSEPSGKRAVETQADCMSRVKLGAAGMRAVHGGWYLHHWRKTCNAKQLHQASSIWSTVAARR